MEYRHAFAIVVFVALAAPSKVDASWIDESSVALSTVAASDTGVLFPREVSVRKFQTLPAVMAFGLSAGVRVNALARSGTDTLFVVDTMTIVGGLTLTPRDIAKRAANGVISMHATAAQLGLPPTTTIDAIAVQSTATDLLLSLGSAAAIGGNAYSSSDVLRWNAGAMSLFRSGASLGLSSSVNLVGLDTGPGGNLFASFDSDTVAASRTIRAGQIHEFSALTSTWSEGRSAQTMGFSCGECDINSFSVVTSSDVIFRSGVESHEF